MKVLRRSFLQALIVYSLLAGVSSGGSGVKEHYNEGVEYASEGKFIQAREMFKEALKIDPGDSSSNHFLKAIEDAIDLKVEKEAAIHLFKGVTFGNEGMRDRSIAEYTNAVVIDPKYASAYYSRGNAYADKGQHDLAISDYTRAIKIDPEHADSYNNRGMAFHDGGQYNRAMSDFTKSKKVDSKGATDYTSRGW